MKKNLIFIIIDALRYDRICNHGYNYKITPNLDELCKEGYSINNHFANGCPTQLSFPSIFSSTYSLDFGGYDFGIKNRPSVLAEVLKKNGYKTLGITTAHPSGSHYGYNRGFDYYENLLDLYQWFRQNLKIFLREPLQNFQNKKITEKEIITVLLKDYKSVLLSTLEYIKDLSNYDLKNNKWNLTDLKKNVLEEIKILESEPKIILEKFLKYDYWYYLYLGKKNIPKASLFFHSLKENLRVKINNIINLFPRRKIYNAKQVFDRFDVILKKNTSHKPFFFFLHLFDLHEAKNFINNISFHFLYSLIKLLFIRKFKFGGFVYDLSLIQLDYQLGIFIRKLKSKQIFKNTTIIVTSDHGLKAGNPIRSSFSKSDISRYFYDEFIKIPLIIYPYAKKRDLKNYLTSHLDTSPTILDLLSIDQEKSFKGKSIFSKDYKKEPNLVYAESNGAGRCDLHNKPIYICIRSQKLKIVYSIEKKIISERDVFCLISDPNEMNNLVEQNSFEKERNLFLKFAEIRLKEIITI